MIARTAPRSLALALSLVLAAPTAVPARAGEKGRAAAAVLKDLDNLHYAPVEKDRLDDPAYIQSYLAAMDAHIKGRSRLIAELVRVDPRNERLPKLLLERWWDVDDALASPEFEKEILKGHPEAVERVRAAQRLRRAIGKPFQLEFKDAISGRSVRTADLKGKVVVVDFWGTACGPCNALMPEMKRLHAQYKDQGVAFIGVELNYTEDAEQGLAQLKKFVARHQIGWPQFYQPEGFESALVSSWGINSIPRIFVVDADGNLVSTTAHGKLKTMVPELLARARANANANPNANAGEKPGARSEEATSGPR